MPERVRFASIVALVLLALALCVTRSVGRVERTILAGAQRALAAAGIPLYDIEVDGRDVVLRGLVGSPDVTAHATTVLVAVPGVRRVVDATTRERIVESPASPAAPGHPAVLRLQRLGDSVYLTGRVGDRPTRRTLVAAARARFGDARLFVELRLQPAVARPTWLEHADGLFGLVQRAGDGARLLLRGDTAVLAAPAVDPATQRRLRATVAELGELHWRLDLPPPASIRRPSGGTP